MKKIISLLVVLTLLLCSISTLASCEGAQGPQGAQGIQGVQGPQGIQGVQGPQGVQGAQGAQGIQGIQGEKGEDGHTPIITIQGGYWYIDGVNTGVLAEGLKGDKGDQGEQGIQGEKGDKGEQGIQGVQGEKGNDGRGILKTEIIDGCLWITYSDAPDTPINVGSVLYEDSASDCFLYQLNEDGESCSIVGWQNCMETELVIPATYKQKPVTGIANSAFQNCTFLKSITIPDSVTTIGSSAFEGCSNLIQVENGISYVDKWAIDCNSSVTSVILRENTVGIGDYAFYDCYNLTSVTIPDSVTTIGDDAFYLCTNLTSVTIGDSVTTIGEGAFSSCSNLTSVTIGDSVTTIGERAFCFCYNLTSITFEGTVEQWNAISKDSGWDVSTGNYTIYCTDGTIAKNGTVTPHSAGLQYTVEYLSFLGNICVITGIGTCTDTDIIIPSMINGMPVKIIGENAFNDIDTLTSITLPSNVNLIRKFAFFDCGNLTQIIMPNVTRIEEGAFSRCISLNDITLPNSLDRIGPLAFGMCTSLRSIVIPYNVSKISSHAFELSDNLTIYCEIDSKPFGWSDDWNFCNYDGSYCPAIWNYRAEDDTTIRHTFGDWYVETEATETDGKVMRRDCQDCDYYETYTFSKIKVYYGVSSSNNLVDANGLSVKYIEQKEDTTTVIANEGEYIYYCSPVEYEECTFYVGGWQGGFYCLGRYSIDGIDYYVYRSTHPNLGETTFNVC